MKMTTCANCGEVLEVGAGFCTACGASTNANAAAPRIAPATPWSANGPAMVPPPPPPPPPTAPPPLTLSLPFAPSVLGREEAAAIDVGKAARTTRGGSSKALVGVVGLAVVGAGVFFGLRLMRGASSDTSGAGNPGEAVTGLLRAVDTEDYAGVASFLAPDEVPDLAKLVSTVRSQAKTIGFTAVDTAKVIDFSSSLDVGDADLLSKSVAKVPVTGSLSWTAGGEWGPILNALADSKATGSLKLSNLNMTDAKGNRVKPFVLVVKTDGRWHVSPMLTAAEYIRIAADLPKGDFEVVDTLKKAKETKSGEDAFKLLATGVSDLDVERAADALAPGERRLLLVYSKAIQNELTKIPRGSRLTIDTAKSVTVKTAFGSGLTIKAIDGSVITGNGKKSFEFDGKCFGSDVCLPSGSDAATVGLDQPAVQLIQVGNSMKISLSKTAITLATSVISKLDRPTALGLLGSEVADDAKPMNLDEETTVETKNPYEVYEVPVGAGDIVSFINSSERYGNIQTYAKDSNGRWKSLYETDGVKYFAANAFRFESAQIVRLVVRSDSACPLLCQLRFTGLSEDTTSGPLTVRASKAQTIQTSMPGTLTANVAYNDIAIYPFVLSQEVVVAMTRGNFQLLDATGQSIPMSDRQTLKAGNYSLVVTGTGQPINFSMVEVASRGFPNGLTQGVTVSSPQSLKFRYETGHAFKVSASPDTGSRVDVILEVFEGSRKLCAVDNNGDGGIESCSFNAPTTDGELTVTVSRATSVSGSVTLTANFT
jgi:hypothetical protein